MSSESNPARRPSRRHAQIVRVVLQVTLPVLVLLLAAGGAYRLISGIEKPKTVPPPPNTPIVRTMTAEPTTMQLDVASQGTVEPAVQVSLAPQVAGRVVSISPSLRAGGFFAAGEVLLNIDPRDFEFALVQRRAEVARARLRLAQEQAEADVAVRAWQQLEGERKPDELATRQLHVDGARADLAAAEAALQRAELDLERTAVTLPFAGRVRSADVDPGDLVQPGAPVAVVYGIDAVEVRLPIPDDQVAFLDLPLGPAAAAGNGGGRARALPVVELVTEFAGSTHTWRGTIVRTEGEIDRRTRQLTLVARVTDPYAVGATATRPPLAPGLYVEAIIAGRTFDDVVSLPRQALRPDGSVLVLDDESRLIARQVTVLRVDRDAVFVRGGIQAGDRVCISVVEEFVEGMPVQSLAAIAPTADGGR